MNRTAVTFFFALSSLVVGACGDDSTTSTSGGTGSGSGGDASSSSDSTSSSSPTGGPSSSTDTTSTSSAPDTSSASTGDGGSGPSSSASTSDSSSSSSGTGGGTTDYCAFGPADRARYAVTGHPFGDGDYATDWEVLALSAEGELTTTGKHFQMGTAEDTPIAFSADGSIGIAVQRDYTLGVFRLDAAGTPTVVDAAAFGLPDFTPHAITLAPSGDYFLVNDVNFPKNGGGLYRIDIDCETGALTFAGLVIESKNAYSAAPLGGGRWAIGAVGVDGVESDDVHVISEGDPWTREGGANPFDYPDVSPQCIAASRDGQLVVAGDSGLFSENHVALVDVSGPTPTVVGEPIQLNGPYSVAISPEGDTAVVAGFKPDALYVLDLTGGFSLRGEVEYSDNGAQIPGAMAQVKRGSLDGLTLVTDVQGVRVLRMGGGEVVDDGVLLFGDEPPFGTYGIGIQP